MGRREETPPDQQAGATEEDKADSVIILALPCVASLSTLQTREGGARGEQLCRDRPPWRDVPVPRLGLRAAARPLPLVLCGLFPPLLLRLAPSATPKPQGQDAQPPAFLPCFPLGDVPQNTQPSGGSGSLAGPLGTHLKALARAGEPLGQPKPQRAGGRAFQG